MKHIKEIHPSHLISRRAVERILDVSNKTAGLHIAICRDALGKHKGQNLTVGEFCEYNDIPLDWLREL